MYDDYINYDIITLNMGPSNKSNIPQRSYMGSIHVKLNLSHNTLHMVKAIKTLDNSSFNLHTILYRPLCF